MLFSSAVGEENKSISCCSGPSVPTAFSVTTTVAITVATSFQKPIPVPFPVSATKPIPFSGVPFHLPGGGGRGGGGGEGGLEKGTVARWTDRGFGFIKPEDGSGGPAYGGFGGGGGGRGGGGQEVRPGDWVCPDSGCAEHNFASRDVCRRCPE
eukprot:gene24163-30534_t